MKISYGPPGHRGVSHLMAVGADELGPTPTAQAVDRGMTGAVIATVAGAVLGMPRLTAGGIGALLALAVVRRVGTQPTTVVVSKSSSSSPSGD